MAAPVPVLKPLTSRTIARVDALSGSLPTKPQWLPCRSPLVSRTSGLPPALRVYDTHAVTTPNSVTLLCACAAMQPAEHDAATSTRLDSRLLRHPNHFRTGRTPAPRPISASPAAISLTAIKNDLSSRSHAIFGVLKKSSRTGAVS